jgi:D-amino-acid dehydrogenase
MSGRRADVIVIGAGVVGLSVAYYASLKGAEVLVLEKGETGSGSSSGNAGLVVPSYFEPLPGPGVIGEALKHLLSPQGFFGIRPRLDPSLLCWLVRFARSCNQRDFEARCRILAKLNDEALGLHLELAEMGGQEYAFSQKGLLFLYLDKARLEEAQERASRAAEFGIRTEIISGDEVRKAEPAAGERVVGGVRYFSDAALSPFLFLEWLTKRACSAGALIRTHCEVYGFRVSGKRLGSVLTTKGEFQGDQVVLAAGAWLKSLGRLLGLQLPVEGGKGISQTFYGSCWSVEQPLILDESHVAVSPLPGALRVTGLLELAGTDLTLSQRRVRGIRNAASLYLPAVRAMEPDEIWRGLRPCTPDGLPLLGRLGPWINVFVAGGHDTKGMTLGPLTGQVLSRLLAGESIGHAEKELRPKRFL